MALEAVRRIGALFYIKRDINRLAAEQRLERRRKDSQPIVSKLHDWLQIERMRAAKAVCLELVISSKSMAYVMRYSDFPH